MNKTPTKLVIIWSATVILVCGLFMPFLPEKVIAAPNANNTTYTLLEPLPCIPTSGVSCTNGQNVTKTDLRTYIPYVFNLLIAVSAVAAVVMITWGGLQYMTTDSWYERSAGKDKIWNAVIGLVMVLCTYLILKTVNPALVAIPATLVPPIKTGALLTSSPQALFDQLQQQAEQYKVDTAQSISDRESAKASVASTQQQLDSVNKQIDDYTTNPNTTVTEAQLNQLLAQQQSLDDQIASQEATQTFNTYNAAIVGTMNSITGSFDQTGKVNVSNANTMTPVVVNDYISKVDKAYTDGTSQLRQLGNPPDKVQQLSDQYNLTHGQLEILSAASGNPNVSAARDLTQMNINAISDPTKKAQLQQMFNKAFK